MPGKPIKFGLTLPGQNPVPELVEEARRAESAGFDVILLGAAGELSGDVGEGVAGT
jgi:hypothetical protein